MIVISDMMGTLTTGSPFLGLVDWIKHNESKLRANLIMASIMPAYVLAKNGIIDWQEWGQKLMVDSLAYIKNADEEKIRQISDWMVEHNLWKKHRDDVTSRLVKHHGEARRSILPVVSSSLLSFHLQNASAHRRLVHRLRL